MITLEDPQISRIDELEKYSKQTRFYSSKHQYFFLQF